ncbi:hypothetical protein OZ830_001503 [Yersinia enterocolitica]|nr:hypothetical protein [Yersinia enterocolitica]EKN6193017.1 hypothetical protein [Yersinia enterocolitica]ELX2272477.1 hypothetical protein [Yersinia enterocolitica]HEN3475891.1 hypothetical protein [Yersinia enterocolitica]
MGMLSPAFREINYARIEKLAKTKKLSNETVAGIIRDETGEDVSAQDIAGYRKVTGIASNRMLVLKDTMDTIAGPETPSPAV